MDNAGAADRDPVHRTAAVASPPEGETSSNGRTYAPLTEGGETVADVDFRAMIERIPAVTYVAGFGESGRWHYVSAQIEATFGFTPDEWQADPDLWFKQIHPEDRGRVLTEEAESKSGAAPLYSEYRMLHRDGRVIWVRDEGVVVRDQSGQPLFWQGFMIDITRRKVTEQALHDSEVQYRSLFDHVPVGLYRTIPDGTLQDANRALAHILGYPTREALLAQEASDVYLDPLDRERWKEALEAAGTISDFEMQLKRRDGGVIWVHDSARVVRDRDDNVLHYEGVLVDITQRKQAEWEARQAHQQLSSKVYELELRNREMSLINEMGNMLQSCPTADEAYAVMAHWAEQLFDGRNGMLCVIAPSRNIVEPVAVWGRSAIAQHAFAPEDCWALRSGRLHMIEDPQSRLVCPHLAESASGPYLCVPMMAQGEALGILHLQAAATGMSNGFGSTDTLKPLVVAVADHLALALANLKLRETLRSQSIRDPLTGLFNRRYMEESLERELRRAERRGQSLGVIMLDLDHFSRFNNTFGHQAGDLLLQAFGELVRARVRVEDIACRYGGEEFTLILPEASLEVTRDRAQQILEILRELHVSHRGESLGAVTMSAGVAAYPDHARTGEGLIRAADTALYIAKAAGRDRIAVAVVDDLIHAPGEASLSP
jgi:diguanylate cyclase (GGDEF)-like protein/PAS domain S-box-containing protein